MQFVLITQGEDGVPGEDGRKVRVPVNDHFTQIAFLLLLLTFIFFNLVSITVKKKSVLKST